MIIFIYFLLLCVVFALIASLINAEPRQRKQTLTEREKFLIEWKLAQEQAKKETARVNALLREQERQAKEQERLAKEQERQAAQLEKHEEQLAKLEHRLAVAEGDIAHWEDQFYNLCALLDIEQAEKAAAVPGSKSDIQHTRKIITLTNQIHAAENRLAKAKFEKSFCESKLEVA